MLIIGLTGNIGTGKTTVGEMFARRGAKIVCADRFGHEALKKGSPCFEAIVKKFGTDIVRDGEIDRKKLGAIVFKNLTALQALNAIVHPVMKQAIAAEMRRQEKEGVAVVLFDVALLFEMHLHRYVDQIVVVKAKRQQMIERGAAKLGIPKAEVVRRLKMQMPLREKIRCADFIIDNSGKLTETKKQVDYIWQELQQMVQK